MPGEAFSDLESVPELVFINSDFTWEFRWQDFKVILTPTDIRGMILGWVHT